MSTKKITFTANSLNNALSPTQWKNITRFFNTQEVDLNHVLTAGRWDGTRVVYDNGTATVGELLAFEMVPDENKPGQMRRNYTVLPHLNRVDAFTLQSYLMNCPKKGSNNGPVQNSTGKENPKLTGFGGIAK